MAIPAMLVALQQRANHSWLLQLRPDPKQQQFAPNRKSREVFSGHYVEVAPTPLPQPSLIIHSSEMAAELGLDDAAVASDAFLHFFSGNIDALPGMRSWATPYALSIMGTEMVSNCPFNTGNGYGDGRAISIGEVLMDNGNRWEMQIKGAGPTPWRRGGDGRAVLRSSIREFLVSEAMHALRVPTTRALSLTLSATEHSTRPWTLDKHTKSSTLDRFLRDRYPPDQWDAVKERIMAQGEEVPIEEACAMTTRVSPSFIRIGHFDLFGRRARQARTPEAKASAVEELRLFLDQRVLHMAEQFKDRLAGLIAGWIRIGFCQGNFNADNCLVGGRTMDYGPFGFVDVFDPEWCSWTGGAPHFSFMNQMDAGFANFAVFARNLVPLLDEQGAQQLKAITAAFPVAAKLQLRQAMASKLGVAHSHAAFDTLLQQCFGLMSEKEADWTIFWRQLAELRSRIGDGDGGRIDAAVVSEVMQPAFYMKGERVVQGILPWLQGQWAPAALSSGIDAATASAAMKQASPKYVPREWMLVTAYKAAERGDYAPMRTLHELFKTPYDEHHEHAASYYKLVPEEWRDKTGVSTKS